MFVIGFECGCGETYLEQVSNPRGWQLKDLERRIGANAAREGWEIPEPEAFEEGCVCPACVEDHQGTLFTK